MPKRRKETHDFKEMPSQADAYRAEIPGHRSGGSVRRVSITRTGLKDLDPQLEFILRTTKTNVDIIDSHFNLIYVDTLWQKIYGDFRGRKCYEYFMKRHKACPACGIPEAIKTGRSVVTEEILVRENNRPVQVTTMPFKNKNGDWFVAEVNVDISDRKRAERELRESEERFRVLVDNIAIGISLISPKMEIMTLNEQMRKWFPDVDPAKRPVCYRSFNRPPRQKICSYCPTCLTLKDGNLHEAVTETPTDRGMINYRIISSPIKNWSGKVIAAIEMVEDITEKKMAEEDLAESKRRLEYAVHVGGIGIWELDLGTHSAWRSPRHDQIFGYDKLLPRWTYEMFLEHVIPQDREAVDRKFHSAINSGTEWDFECRIRRKDGEVRWIWAQGRGVEPASATKPMLLIGMVMDITARKRMEEDLRKHRDHLEELVNKRTNEFRASEIRYRRLFEAAKDGVLIVNADSGDIIDVNQFMVDLIGFPKEYFYGKKLWEIGIFKDIEMSKKAFRELIEKEYIRYENLPLNAKNGEVIDVEFVSNVYRVGEGKVVQCNIRDIRRRKRAEDLLRESEACFRAIFDESRDGLLLADVDTKQFIMWNKTICRMLGYGERGMKGLSITDIHPAGALSEVMEVFESQARGQLKLAPALPVKRKDGSVFYADINTTPLVLHGKKCLMGSFRDITERKIYEENLGISEESYRTIFESANDAIVIRDINTYRVIDANNKACEMFCYPKDEILGLGFKDVTTGSRPHAAGKLKKIYGDIGSGGEPQIFEWLMQDKFKRQFWVEVSVKRAIIKGKYCFLSIIRDITDRKRLADTKNDFMNMVSHELRTPLSVIKEGISLAAGGDIGTVTEMQGKVLTLAKNNADRLTRLINQVLDFQQLDAGRMEFKFKENNINEVIEEVYRGMLSLASKKRLKLILKLDNGLARIRFDADKIIEVLNNLIGNAIKFTEKGSITITSSRGDNVIMVSIQDTGCGIKEKDMNKLFQRFSQLKRKPGGTGLGLAISKDLIEAHKGKIWAESKAGEGTSFHFVLPIIERRECYGENNIDR